MSTKAISFHWRYIILPLVIMFLSIILVVYFYQLLPAEVAYHFKSGAPDKWVSRSIILVWALAPQFLFPLLAAVIIWIIIKINTRFRQMESDLVSRSLSLMGNMVALPQVILSFAMLDIFSYNVYQVHLMSLWLFALIIMLMGGIILSLFFLMAIRKSWRQPKIPVDRNKQEQH